MPDVRGGEVSLRRADASLRPVVEHLAQLERHDLSELVDLLPGPDGLFDVPRLPRFFTDADHEAHLIHAGDDLAGFCLVRPYDDGSSFVQSFFVVRALRRYGVGAAAAVELLRSRPERWSIAFLEENEAAAAFWRRVAAVVADDGWTEERRPSPDAAHTFTVLTLDLTPAP